MPYVNFFTKQARHQRHDAAHAAFEKVNGARLITPAPFILFDDLEHKT